MQLSFIDVKRAYFNAVIDKRDKPTFVDLSTEDANHGSMFGFIEVEELVFGERSSVVLDPGEERVKSEFAGVTRSFLPMHSVLRIDEVKQQGVSKISSYEGSNVAQFPIPMYAPPSGDSGPGK